jgi:hypothetical protein
MEMESLKFAQHLTDKKHSIAPMEDIMEILNMTKKGSMMNTLQRFHIYNITGHENQINDKDRVKYKAIFGKRIHKNSCRGHSLSHELPQ